MADKDYQEHFLRQRRNLMGFSIFILVVNLSGAQVEKINLLGNEVLIYRHGLLTAMLLLAVVYFLFRYLQFYTHLDSPIWDYFQPAFEKVLGTSLINRKLKSDDDFRKRWRSDLPLRYVYSGLLSSTYWKGYFQVAFVGSKGAPKGVEQFKEVGVLRCLYSFMIGATIASVKTPVFTEYILPVLLAFLGMISFVFRVSSPYLCAT